MPDGHQLRTLGQGTESWNQWRLENPAVTPRLNGACLEGKLLFALDLRQADLRRANLKDADLLASDLQGANLEGADLGGAHLDLTFGLVQSQIDAAFGDEFTRLPEGLDRPASWTAYQQSGGDYEEGLSKRK